MLQTLVAVEQALGADARAALALQAELPDEWPEGLIPEAWFIRTIDALRWRHPDRSEALLRRAGEYTADYVARHRIPKLFQRLLGVLADGWAVPLLLFAFQRHAWTFAGSARFSVASAGPRKWRLVLDGAPTCPPAGTTGTALPLGGAYYEAAFEGLLRLASRRVRVREATCRRRGDPDCRFSVTL